MTPRDARPRGHGGRGDDLASEPVVGVADALLPPFVPTTVFGNGLLTVGVVVALVAIARVVLPATPADGSGDGD